VASTLVKRICDTSQLTVAEVASVIAEKGYTDEGNLKLGLHAVVGVAQEIDAGRLPPQVMLTWLTAAEYLDALAMIAKITNGTFSVTELWLILLLGERQIYTPAQIEAIWGI
jgi:hypothetical protein